jgi:hypothetical protein
MTRIAMLGWGSPLFPIKGIEDVEREFERVRQANFSAASFGLDS